MQDQTARVLLVNMPFSSLRWPAIGISLLKSGLERRGLTCDTAYFNFDFAETIGLELYDRIIDSFGFVLGGERVFAQSFFEGQLPDDPSYFRHVLGHTIKPNNNNASSKFFLLTIYPSELPL